MARNISPKLEKRNIFPKESELRYTCTPFLKWPIGCKISVNNIISNFPTLLIRMVFLTFWAFSKQSIYMHKTLNSFMINNVTSPAKFLINSSYFISTLFLSWNLRVSDVNTIFSYSISCSFKQWVVSCFIALRENVFSWYPISINSNSLMTAAFSWEAQLPVLSQGSQFLYGCLFQLLNMQTVS